MNSTLRAVLVVALCGSAVNAQMLYDQGPPQHRIVHKNTLAVRVNPLGLLYDGRFSYRLRLYESESKSLRDNFLGVGVAPLVGGPSSALDAAQVAQETKVVLPVVEVEKYPQ